MPEGFDDFEMEDLAEKYSEYNDMNEQELNDEYYNLIQKRLNLLKSGTNPQDEQFVNAKERIDYIDRIQVDRQNRSAVETTFTDNKDGKTVTIERKGDPSTRVLAPELDRTVEPPTEPENEKIFAIEDFIRRNYDKNFTLDPIHNEKALELIQNIEKNR